MRLYLCGVRIPLKAEGLLNEALRDTGPVEVRVGDFVRVQIADCSIKFTLRVDSLDLFDLLLKSVGEVRELFTHGGGCSALTVCAAHHRYVCVSI